MSISPVTRTPTVSELFNTPSRGSAPQPPRGSINWTYIVIGGVVIVGIVGTYVYFNCQSRRRQKEMMAHSSKLNETQTSTINAHADIHRESQEQIHSRLDHLELGLAKTTQLLESATLAGKILVQDVYPIIESTMAAAHQSKSNSINP
jgi:hypothetical protein